MTIIWTNPELRCRLLGATETHENLYNEVNTSHNDDERQHGFLSGCYWNYLAQSFSCYSSGKKVK